MCYQPRAPEVLKALTFDLHKRTCSSAHAASKCPEALLNPAIKVNYSGRHTSLHDDLVEWIRVGSAEDHALNFDQYSG